MSYKKNTDALPEGASNLYFTNARAVSALESVFGSRLRVNGGAVEIKEVIALACSDEVSVLAVGTAVVTFRMPFAMTVTKVKASLSTGTTGDVVQVDINENGTSILSTKLTIDAGEKTSETAATPPVISDTALANDSEITIDIDSVDGFSKGLKVYIEGWVA